MRVNDADTAVVVALLALFGSLGSTMLVAVFRRHWDVEDRRRAEAERLRETARRSERACERMHHHAARMHDALRAVVLMRDQWLRRHPRSIENWEAMLVSLARDAPPAPPVPEPHEKQIDMQEK